MIKLKGYNIDSKTESGETFILFKTFFSVVFDFLPLTNQSKELRNVSKANILAISGGRHRKTYVSFCGVIEYLQKTTRISVTDKQAILKSLSDQGMGEFTPVFNTRKEIVFFDELKDYLSAKKYKGEIKTQQSVSDYVVDAIIGGLIVEYDEDCHISYDKEAEDIRSKYLLSSGFKLVRVSDKNSNGFNIGVVSEVLGI